MSVDGVGAVGGGAPVSPVSKPAGIALTGDVSPAGEVSPVEDLGVGGEMMAGAGSRMCTSDFVSLHNNLVQQINNCQTPEIDLEKIIEMMIAIKLLQEMNKNG